MERRFTMLAAAAVAAMTMAATAPVAAAAGGPYCGIRWGSLAKSAPATSVGTLENVRAGRHACFERLVLDADGEADGYRVRYVSQVREDGSGDVVPVRGGARIQIDAIVPAYDEDGNSTYDPANKRELVNVSGWRTFRQVAWAGSFEGQSTIGLGVRARLPFRVFTLDGPGDGSRIVVDVAHRW